MENLQSIVVHPDTREEYSIVVGCTQEKFDSALSYKPDDSDIFVCSYPKCGTTWLQNITWLITRNGESMDTEAGLFDQLPFLEYNSAEIKKISNKNYPRIIKTHLPRKWLPWNPKSKYLFVTRDPRDVVVSLFYHQQGFESVPLQFCLDDFFELFILKKSTYGDFFEFLQGYINGKDPNVLVLYYEDLKRQPNTQIMKIARFLGAQYEHDLLKDDMKALNEITRRVDISEMRKYEHFLAPRKRRNGWPFIRKGEIGDWKNHLTNEQVELLLERLKQTVPQLEKFWWEEK